SIILPNRCNRPCQFNTPLSVLFRISSPRRDACRPGPPTISIYLLTRCRPVRARCTAVSNGRLLSNSKVCHKKRQRFQAVYSNRSEDFSAVDKLRYHRRRLIAVLVIAVPIVFGEADPLFSFSQSSQVSISIAPLGNSN